MKEILYRLLAVKSIVTIMLTIFFGILCLKGDISQEMLTIYTTVIAFYFGTQHEREK